MKIISLIVPAYNEEKNIAPLYEKLEKVVFAPLRDKYAFELVFVNDGSRDGTGAEIEKLVAKHPEVNFIDFSRNFGKEIATTAGINFCTGDACLMIDADLQHPAELIPQFIEKWEEGFEVVVGVRKNNAGHGLKTLGAKTFYAILNKISEVKVIPGATDFRLIDRAVIDEFNRFTETNRMTRALIDWLGFRRAYIYFDANERLNGEASYSLWKLAQLAFNGFISLSMVPLKLAGYFGAIITLLSGLLGVYILLGKYIFHWYFAYISSNVVDLAVFIVFLVGIILISMGFTAFYIANIQKEVINRPMYVIRKKKI
jgi:dolichol-phosphate mannosyltransferase